MPKASRRFTASKVSIAGVRGGLPVSEMLDQAADVAERLRCSALAAVSDLRSIHPDEDMDTDEIYSLENRLYRLVSDLDALAGLLKHEAGQRLPSRSARVARRGED